MGRCNCKGTTCACVLVQGDGIEITGTGTPGDPYVITNTGAGPGGGGGDPGDPPVYEAYDANMIFQDDYNGVGTVMDTTGGSALNIVAGRHYFVYTTRRKDDENYYPGPDMVISFSGGGLVFPGDPVASPMTVPPTAARRTDVFLARATASGSGHFTATSGVTFSTGTMLVVEVAGLHYDGSAYDCLGLHLNPQDLPQRIAAGVLSNGNLAETVVQLEEQEYITNAVMLFSARGDGTTETPDAPLVEVAHAEATNISNSIHHHHGPLTTLRSTHSNGSYLAWGVELYVGNNVPTQPVGCLQIGTTDATPTGGNTGTVNYLDDASTVPMVAGTPMLVAVLNQRAAAVGAVSSVASPSNTFTLVPGADQTFDDDGGNVQGRLTVWVCENPVTANENITIQTATTGHLGVSAIAIALPGAATSGTIPQAVATGGEAVTSLTDALADFSGTDPDDACIGFVATDNEGELFLPEDGWRRENDNKGVLGQGNSWWSEPGSGTRHKIATIFRRSPGDGTGGVSINSAGGGAVTPLARDAAMILLQVHAA